jgi:hypothetical protein
LSTTVLSWTRTGSISVQSVGGNTFSHFFGNAIGSSLSSSFSVSFLGYENRDGYVTARDKIMFLLPAIYSFMGSVFALVNGNNISCRLQSDINSTAALIREPLMMVGVRGPSASPFNTNGTETFYKGKCKWIQIAPLGNSSDTFDGKLWVAITSFVSNTSTPSPCVIVGPYDGTTTLIA